MAYIRQSRQYAAWDPSHRSRSTRRQSNEGRTIRLILALALLGGFVSGLAVGLLARGVKPRTGSTELAMARSLAGGHEVRLIGHDCGDRRLTGLAQHEDEFPESGCREIRPLREE